MGDLVDRQLLLLLSPPPYILSGTSVIRQASYCTAVLQVVHMPTSVQAPGRIIPRMYNV